MNTTYINYFLRSDEENFNKTNLIYRIVGFLQETRDIWRGILKRNEERRQLSRMSDYMLNDIGITRAEANREIDKWFWQV